MTKIYGMPKAEVINYKYSKLIEDWYFFSDIIGLCRIPEGFTCDWESVPLLKGTSKVSGLIHDYLSRKDSVPLVTKEIAAKVYLEFLKFRGQGFIRRYAKYITVRFAFGYFHKKKVNWQLEGK